MSEYTDYWYENDHSYHVHIPWIDDWYMDEDDRMAEYDDEVLDSPNAEEDYWVGARYARRKGG